MRCAIFFLGFASIGLGQMDGSLLRAKFGAPLNREVFTVRPGIEMVVDYSPTGNHACRLELPGLAPAGVGVNTKKLIDDLLLEIVPLSMRGKEGGKMCESMGRMGMCSADYEHLSILESLDGGDRKSVVVKFKIAGCSGDR